MNSDPTSLDRLHDIIVPPPVPWWPPAPGVQWLFVCGAVVLLAVVLRAFLHWQRNRYRREALAEFRRWDAMLSQEKSRLIGLSGLAELLKRTALSAFPREEVAALTGAPWLAFLDRTGGGGAAFASEEGALLEAAAYRAVSEDQLEAARVRQAAELVERWIEHHRAPVGKDEGC